MTSIIVVLPAPFGPMMAQLAHRDVQRQLVQRAEAVERDGDVVQVQDGAVARGDAVALYAHT